MLILGIDFETTGLDPAKHVVTEVGAVLWDTEVKAPVKVLGYLVKTDNAVFEQEAIDITGITSELCQRFGLDSERALRQLLALYQQADFMCAHNGAIFDRKFLNAWIQKHGIEFTEDKLWIDTNTDISYPSMWSSRLSYLATEHSFINPFPHRAVFDVMTMLRILSQYDLAEVLRVAASPTLVIRANVSIADKDKAKNRGYHAQYNEYGKFQMWSMTIKECNLEKERAEAGFPIEIVTIVK